MKRWKTTIPPGSRQEALFRMLHRVRAVGFLIGFVIIAIHQAGRGYSPWHWGLLVLQFFLYPQVLHWRTFHAPVPSQAEHENLLMDACVLGLWAASLGYPLWITFTMLSGNVVAITLYRGLRSAAYAISLFFLTGLALIAVVDTPINFSTDGPATALSVVGVMIFLLLAASAAYRRTIKLRETRKALKASEETLQAQLDEIRTLQGRLHELANRDSLTGLYNRRYLDSTLERELARCKRADLPLSLILLDLDHFKQINDTYGHQAGDEVLRQLAGLLAGQARAGDVACRYGGEEFLLLLPNMPLAIAVERAEQWRAAAAATEIEFGELRVRVTLSIGVAAYPEHGADAVELIRHADRALYEAKAQGRDRVVVFGGTPAGR